MCNMCTLDLARHCCALPFMKAMLVTNYGVAHVLILCCHVSTAEKSFAPEFSR